MNKQEFIANLQTKLCGLPEQDVGERIDFYIEIIDDRMEDGISEEEAVSQIGSVDEIAAQIIADVPFTRIAKEKIKSKIRLKVWEIVLLALGSPIWLSLAVATFVVVLAIYVVIWSVIISLWAIFTSLTACATCGIVASIVFTIGGNGLSGITTLCAGLLCAGLAIFLFFGCKATTKGTILLTKKIAISIKRCFIKKEDA